MLHEMALDGSPRQVSGLKRNNFKLGPIWTYLEAYNGQNAKQKNQKKIPNRQISHIVRLP